MCFLLKVATCGMENWRMADSKEFQPGKYLAEYGWIMVSIQEALSAVWIRCKQSSWQTLLPPSKKRVPQICVLPKFSGQWRSRVSDWLWLIWKLNRILLSLKTRPLSLFQTIPQVDVAPTRLDGFGLLFPGGVVVKMGYTAVKSHEVA